MGKDEPKFGLSQPVRPVVRPTAKRVEQPGLVTMSSGVSRPVWVGDWVIFHGPIPVEVVPHKAFETIYEAIDASFALPEPQRGQLEDLLGVGATSSATLLVSACAQLASLEIGGIKIGFTSNQWAELKAKAEKNGTSVTAEVERIVTTLTDQFFWNA